MGFFEKIKNGLKKTRAAMANTLGGIFASFSGANEEFYEELEESMILADIGVETSCKAVEQLRTVVKERKLRTAEEIHDALKDILVDMLNVGDTSLKLGTRPSVVLVIGVNGRRQDDVHRQNRAPFEKQRPPRDARRRRHLPRRRHRAACRLGRPRAGAARPSERGAPTPPPSSLTPPAAARKQGIDVLIVDTAGRLHNKKNLLDELAKINRVLARELPESSRETLLVLDASTGQNALMQAKEFTKAAEITGIVLTKLDGTAKGGVVFAVKRELGIPVKFIGVGEGAEDLQPFSGADFVRAMFERDGQENAE